MKLLRSDQYQRMPWKNGGGETAQIVVSPEDATLTAFDWRISMARVAIDGPFSLFPEVDRTLVVLDGVGLTLHGADASVMEVAAGTAGVSFSGDTPLSARLLDGAITDLNIMTRRRAYRHRVQYLPQVLTGAIAVQPYTQLLVLAVGQLTVDSGTRVQMSVHDTVVIEPLEQVTLHPAGNTEAYLIEIMPVTAHRPILSR
jgi:environmental stress-induced protein Ves